MGRRASLLLLALGLGACAACSSGGARDVLAQRARWKVELVDWARAAEGSITLSVRVSGPPTTSLERLSFRITLFDGEQRSVGQVWRTIDLAQVPRGAPRELFFRLDPPDRPVEGLAVSLVPQPSPEERRHIVELEEP